jgi:glycosyltransferase involved in cell wall biosynthesis
VFSPSRFPTASDLRWQRAIIGVRDVQLICSTDTMRRFYVERGVPIERCHLIRPGVEFSRVNRRRNDALRLKLGFGPEAFVLLACGEHVRGANHNATILCATTLNLYNPKYKILLWGRGDLDRLTRRFASLMLPRNFIRFASDRLGKQVMFEDLLPAADAMLITADGPLPTLPIAVAMAAGLPMVAVVSTTVSELLEDRHTAFMLKETRGRLLARRLLDLEDHNEERWKMSDTARTEAFEYFSMTRFINQMNAVYEQVAQGKLVQVPQPAPGAGARFLGRA